MGVQPGRPPRGFLRKDVISRELHGEGVQGCDSEWFMRFAKLFAPILRGFATICCFGGVGNRGVTRHSNTVVTKCQTVF